MGTPKVSPQSIGESHRLKYNLLRLNSGNILGAVLFAGYSEREGTSTVLSQFAHTLASDGGKVILVDANLRSLFMSALFTVDREKGFSDLLLGKSTLAGAIRETGLPNLSLIPSGAAYPNPTALLESPSLEALIQEMKGRAEWVLLDSPPHQPLHGFHHSGIPGGRRGNGGGGRKDALGSGRKLAAEDNELPRSKLRGIPMQETITSQQAAGY